MKPLPTLTAVAVALVLIASPIAVTAAGTITFTSPSNGSFKATQAYTIAGTTSSAQSPNEVFITVKNPSGQTVDAASPSVTAGSFSYATSTCGNCANWVSGTYTITATDSYGATGTTYFTYATVPPFNTTAWILDIARNQTIIENQLKTLQKDLAGNFSANAAAEAKEATADASIQSSLNGITSSLSTMAGQLTSLQNSVGSISTAQTNMQNTLNSISSQLNTAVTQAQNAANTASNTSTYVLVVAVLAAITLVLELAILVRKLS